MKLTSEAEIRRDINAAANARGRETLDQAVLDRWVQIQVAKARDEGVLITDIQLRDLRAKRKLVVGDRARYVGVDRDEELDAGRKYRRPNGQMGVITQIIAQPDTPGRLVVFRPDPDVLLKDEELVELVVRENTPGYWDLERVPA